MGIKLSNNANATLAASIISSSTSITVTSGQGARFPTLSAGDYFYATLIDTSNNLEIVKCTARSTDVLTVVRAQESTTARAYSTGDRIEIRLTAQTFVDATTVTPAMVSDQANTSTGYLDLPSGTTAQRPGTPGAGMIRHNTTTGYIEYWDTSFSSWIGLGAFAATGGTIVSSGAYTYHTFTTSSNFVVAQGAKTVEVLIVAGGGGGGGARQSPGGGGGGAGGLVYATFLASAGSYVVSVGGGGAGTFGNPDVHAGGTYGTNGTNSSFYGQTAAVGGGVGGSYSNCPAGSGGSGGGGSWGGTTGGSGTSGQGNAGGNNSQLSNQNGPSGGGAGAAGTIGSGATNAAAANGGVGVNTYSTWATATSTGDSGYYAGGGGAGQGYNAGCGATNPSARSSGGLGGGGTGGRNSAGNMTGGNGSANTGGGGGGAGSDCVSNMTNQAGGNGGSGVVIVRYLT